MAGLWCESFQVYPSIANMLEGAWAQIDGGWALSTANPPEGGQNLRWNSAGGGNLRRILGASKASCGLAYRLYVPNLPNYEGTPFEYPSDGCMLAVFSDAANIPSTSVVLGTDGALVAYSSYNGGLGIGVRRQGALLQRSQPCVIPGAYNHLEFFQSPLNSGGGIEARVNGVTRLNFSGNCNGISSNQVAQITLCPASGQGVNFWDVSDMHAWDTLAGQGPQWFVGNAAVLTRPLDADSSPEEWQPSASGGPTYLLLQDNNDGTYISTPTVGAEESFMGAAFPSDVIGVVYQQVNFRGYKTGAGDCDVTPGIISGGILADAAQAAIFTPQPTWYWGIIADDPATSGAPFSVPAANASKLALTRTL